MRRAAGRGATRSPGSEPAGRGSSACGRPAPGPEESVRRAARGGPVTRKRGALGTARLRRREEYDAVYRAGRRRSSRLFTVFFAPNGLGESRFGMSVGRALGGSVARNRIRRRVREILRLSRREIPSGWDIIVHPRAPVAGTNFALLRGELLELLGNSIPAGSVPSSREPEKRGPDTPEGNPAA